MKCPCRMREDNNIEFKDCCEPILNGEKAKTAEQVMRSRYSAYTQNNIDHIEETQATNDDFDREEAAQWAANSEWFGLDVVRAKQETPEQSMVEFKAFYKDKNSDKANLHHEVARFSLKAGNWLYEDGSIMGAEPYTRTTPKVGRNDPCSCGSGKKFKKCCGA